MALKSLIAMETIAVALFGWDFTPFWLESLRVVIYSLFWIVSSTKPQ